MSLTVSSSKSTLASINVTPLIDVLLVLLIIFMVVTPLKPTGLGALIPQPAQDRAPSPPWPDRTVVVSINADRTLLINNEPIAEQNLGARLEQIFRTRAERVVFVQGHRDLEFQHVARAIDITKGAGIDRIGLITPGSEAGR